MSLKPLLVFVTLLFAIPLISNAEDADKQTESKSATKPPMQAHLGIGVEPLPPILTSHLPEVIGKGRGILISEVTKSSPADKAGLQKNDVLIRYDDQDLYAPEQLVKRVKNDEPGSEVELEYVRAGKIASVKVTLGEKAQQDQIKSDWPGFTRQFDVPMIPYRPDFLTEEDDLADVGTEWTQFQSMSVMKDASGKYKAKVKYKGENGEVIDREYTGTRQEVRDAIESDNELPDDQKQQLLRSLDDRGEPQFPNLQLPKFPNWGRWNSELFNWPNLSF